MLKRILFFIGRSLRDFGSAQCCLSRCDLPAPEFATAPGHPERVIPLAKLPEGERRWWKEFEKTLW